MLLTKERCRVDVPIVVDQGAPGFAPLLTPNASDWLGLLMIEASDWADVQKQRGARSINSSSNPFSMTLSPEARSRKSCQD